MADVSRLEIGDGCWVAKRRHYLIVDGKRAESVIAYGTKESMQAIVVMWNDAYQSDSHYIEEWSEDKFEWPSFPDLTKYSDLLD